MHNRQRYAQIVKAYRSGMTLAAVGKVHGICRERVRQILVAQGEQRRRFVPPKTMSRKQLGEIYGIGQGRVTLMLQRKYSVVPKYVTYDQAEYVRKALKYCNKCFTIVRTDNKIGRCSGCVTPKYRYTTDPVYRAKRREYIVKWRQKNPEKAKAIQRRAAKRYNERLKKIKSF